MDYYTKIKSFCDYIFNHLSDNKKSTHELQKIIDEKERKIQELYDELTCLHELYCETEKELIDMHKNNVRLIGKMEDEFKKHIKIEQRLRKNINELKGLISDIFT